MSAYTRTYTYSERQYRVPFRVQSGCSTDEPNGARVSLHLAARALETRSDIRRSLYIYARAHVHGAKPRERRKERPVPRRHLNGVVANMRSEKVTHSSILLLFVRSGQRHTEFTDGSGREGERAISIAVSRKGTDDRPERSHE